MFDLSNYHLPIIIIIMTYKYAAQDRSRWIFELDFGTVFEFRRRNGRHHIGPRAAASTVDVQLRRSAGDQLDEKIVVEKTCRYREQPDESSRLFQRCYRTRSVADERFELEQFRQRRRRSKFVFVTWYVFFFLLFQVIRIKYKYKKITLVEPCCHQLSGNR